VKKEKKTSYGLGPKVIYIAVNPADTRKKTRGLEPSSIYIAVKRKSVQGKKLLGVATRIGQGM